jgi:hypothetical protein
MPGKRTDETWEDFYRGRETGPGMTRERTMQLARHALKNAPKHLPVTAKRTVSTPTHPAVRPDNLTE